MDSLKFSTIGIKSSGLHRSSFNFAFLFEEGKDDVLIKDFEIKKNQIERREIENKIEIKKVLFELVSILQTNNKNY